MPINNSVFNSFKKSTVITNRGNTLDSAIMDKETEKVFNTYKYWKPFGIPMQGTVSKENNSDGSPKTDDVTAVGIKSLFNNYNALFVDNEYLTYENRPLLDNPETRRTQRNNMACTIKDLVDASMEGKMGRQVYNYSDFAFCKHLGKIPNNYLITLRRFGFPCGDRIDKRISPLIEKSDDEIQQHSPDIGRLITWIGTPGNDMSNILKYSYGVDWEDVEAKIEDVNDGNMEGTGPLASIFNMSNSDYRKMVQKGQAGANFSGKSYMDKMVGGSGYNAPYPMGTWNKMYDSNKIYGPIDVINRSKKRKTGLKFEQKFSLTFEYELRSYYGINGRAAMADLLGNILATTYTHGTFWGGERRFVNGVQDNVFANLPIFKLADSGGLNNPGAVLDAFIDSINQGAAAFTGGMEGESTAEKIKNLASDIGGMLLGGLLNKLGRPQKYYLSSLISDAPVGCWHLTIGNPKAPIIEVGNLVCTGSEIEHFGPLGLDDFPVGIRVKINLEHAKPRDIVGIEQMYGRGDTRIYSPMGDKVLDMYNNSTSITQQNSKNGTVDTKPDQSNTSDMKNTDNTAPTTNYDLTSLMRYFGTTENSLIQTAGGEALYGAEKHKNDHIQK